MSSETVSDPVTAIFGVFARRPAAELALDTLRTAGFRSSDVSVLFANLRGVSGSEGTDEPGLGADMLGWLSGIGALSIPGAGSCIAAGPIMAMLGGWGTRGTPSGLGTALVALGIPEYEARSYERCMRGGGVLVSIHCEGEEWERRACSVLEQHGAEELSRNPERSAAEGSDQRRSGE